jgi:hypothetical protein
LRSECTLGRADPVERHSREQASLDRQVDQPLVLEDLEHEARVFPVVLDQRLRIVSVHSADLGGRIGRLAVDPLAASQDRPRDGIEAIVLEAQRVANERNSVQHHATRNLGARLAREAAILLEAQRPVDPSEVPRKAERFGATRPDREVEVDDVPSDEQVRVELADPGLRRGEQPLLVVVDEGTRDAFGRDQMDFLDLVPYERDGVDAARVGRGLEVDRNDPKGRVALRRLERGVVEAQESRSQFLRRPVDGDTGADSAVDPVQVGEADVGGERIATRRREPIPKARHGARDRHDDPHHRPPRQVTEIGLLDLDVRAAGNPIGVFARGEEVRPEAVVLDEERLASGEPAEELNHRPSLADAVGRLEDEAGVALHGATGGVQ